MKKARGSSPDVAAYARQYSQKTDRVEPANVS
jgi:hypothetical protein